MTLLPMFPLGSVLLPGMPLSLHIFEPRYLEMMHAILPTPGEFGVVLIERGGEVGGGDKRFSLGTVAEVAGIRRTGSRINLVARGGGRIRVVQWRPDDPYPCADVEYVPELVWRDADAPLLVHVERVVRRALAVVSEFTDTNWPPNVTLPGAEAELAWRLAAVAPIGPLDHQKLLGHTSASEMLECLLALTIEAEQALTFVGDED